MATRSFCVTLVILSLFFVLMFRSHNAQAAELSPERLSGDFYWRLHKDGYAIITSTIYDKHFKGFTGTPPQILSVPTEIEGYPVREIGYRAFDQLEVQQIFLPEGLHTIRESAFFSTGILCLMIPSTVELIEPAAIAYNNFMEEICVAEKNQHYKVVNDMLLTADGKEVISCPQWHDAQFAAIVPEGVEVIRSYAFAAFNSPTTIALPNTLTTIEDYAICSQSLEEIVIPANTQSAGVSIFRSPCIRTVHFEGIPDYIADNIFDIWDIAFYFDFLPEPEILYRFSSDCQFKLFLNLLREGQTDREILQQSLDRLNDMEQPRLTDNIIWHLDGNGNAVVEGTAYGLFEDYVEIFPEEQLFQEEPETLFIPAKLDGHPVTEIASGAFLGLHCNIVIPKNVRIVRQTVCPESSIPNMTIPSTVTLIEDSAFTWSDGLMEFHMAEGNQHYQIKNGMLLTADGKELIDCPSQGDTAFTAIVPEGVEIIHSFAFSHSYNMEALVLPDSLVTIEDDAFSDMRCSLSDIYLPSNVRYVGSHAFDGSINYHFSGVPEKLGPFAFPYDTTIFEGYTYRATFYFDFLPDPDTPYQFAKAHIGQTDLEQVLSLLREGCTDHNVLLQYTINPPKLEPPMDADPLPEVPVTQEPEDIPNQALHPIIVIIPIAGAAILGGIVWYRKKNRSK